MKNRKNVISLLILTILIALLAVTHLVPVLAQPGDANDPLVTRRYVDDRITQLSQEVTQLRNMLSGMTVGAGGTFTLSERDLLFAEVMAYFETVYGDMLRAAAAGAGEAGAVVPFETVNVPAGRTLVADAGVEMILRSGHATAVSGPDGMVNVTAGTDITNGTRIPTNNLLLVPRSDGRGMYFVTEGWLMIKGSYEIRD